MIIIAVSIGKPSSACFVLGIPLSIISLLTLLISQWVIALSLFKVEKISTGTKRLKNSSKALQLVSEPLCLTSGHCALILCEDEPLVNSIHTLQVVL